MTQFSNRSFWIDDYGDYLPGQPLQDDINVDVAIIGGGYTGMATAWELMQRDDSVSVAVLESEIVGFGASGRNMGWVVPHFGLDQATINSLYGKTRTKEAYEYCAQGVAYVRKMIDSFAMQSDYRHSGVMRVALGKHGLPALDEMQKLYDDLGVGDELEWLDRDALQREINSPLMEGGIYEPNMGTLNPCKHVREWKRLAMDAGVSVFENTPATCIDRAGGKVRVQTPRGDVLADKLVLATNAYSHLLKGEIGQAVARDQAPVFVQLLVTEPLSDAQWNELRWQRRNAIEGTLNLFHHFVPTPDGRIMLGFVHHLGVPKRNDMAYDFNPANRELVIRHFRQIFPCIKEVKVVQEWGGPISATLDLVPHIGFVGDERVIYATGCWGHGVALSHQNGRTIADLLCGQETERTDFWVVKRKPRKWPWDPFSYWSRKSVVGLFKWQDKQSLKKSALRI